MAKFSEEPIAERADSQFVLDQIEVQTEATMSQLFLQIERMKDEHEDWFHDYDDFDVYVCERQFLMQLLAGIPEKFELLRGYIAGIWLMRLAMHSATDREFH